MLGDFDLPDNKQNSMHSGDFSPPEFMNATFNWDKYDYQKADIYALGIIFMKMALLMKSF